MRASEFVRARAEVEGPHARQAINALLDAAAEAASSYDDEMGCCHDAKDIVAGTYEKWDWAEDGSTVVTRNAFEPDQCDGFDLYEKVAFGAAKAWHYHPDFDPEWGAERIYVDITPRSRRREPSEVDPGDRFSATTSEWFTHNVAPL